VVLSVLQRTLGIPRMRKGQGLFLRKFYTVRFSRCHYVFSRLSVIKFKSKPFQRPLFKMNIRDANTVSTCQLFCEFKLLKRVLSSGLSAKLQNKWKHGSFSWSFWTVIRCNSVVRTQWYIWCFVYLFSSSFIPALNYIPFVTGRKFFRLVWGICDSRDMRPAKLNPENVCVV